MSQLAVAPRIVDVSGGARPAGGTVRRTALVNRLRAAWSYPVATIVAPIGYGKSTLLEQWAARDDRRFVWVTPDPGVDGLETLVAGIDAALDAAADELAEGGAVAIFDDVHLLHRGALAAVAPLVRLAGEGSMIVLAGRTGPAIPNLSIPGLRVRGELLELGIEDLAFTRRETGMAVQAVGGSLTDAEITAVFEETEGWPAAVGLAASPSGYAPLQAECLAALTPEQRVMLRRTSILERVDRELCDAVLGYPPGERELQSIDDLGAFLVPLDRRRRWFRYHRLLRTALREELESVEPEILPLLHRRAADWFEAEHDAEHAMEHAYAAGDIPRFMRIFSANALKAHNGGRDAAVERWIEHVGDAGRLETFPDAAVLAARLHAHRGQRDEAARCLDAAERGVAESQPADSENVAGARASLVHAATGSPAPTAMLRTAEGALRCLSADDPWRPYGLLLQAVASLLLGETERADDLFGCAAHAADRLGSTETRALALAERALLADGRGEHAKADAYLERIHATDESLDGFASYALTSAASARGLLRHGRWVEARRELGAAQNLVPGLTEALPWLAVQTRLELAGAWIMLRDPAAARPLVDEADRILAVHPKLGVLCRQRDAVAAEIDTMPSAAPGRTVRLTAAELRLLPLLATHLSFREIGAHFFLSRHTVKTQAISAYRKLGASSRSEAVQRAELLGLIERMTEAVPSLATGG